MAKEPIVTVVSVPAESQTQKQEPIVANDANVVIDDSLKIKLDILDSTNGLCNTVLYCLTKGFYPGADAHLVNQSKEFVKAIKQDVENKRKELVSGKPVDLGQSESK